MKGVRMTLDTKVNKNYVEDWRKVGWYDKASDSITATSANNQWVTPVDNLCSSLGKIGDFVTISFDCYGDGRLAGWNLSKEAFVLCEATINTSYLFDHGTIQFSSPNKYRRLWVTYKLTKGEGPSFFVEVGLAGDYSKFTLHIRNIKVELSDHPTDYEE